MDNWRVDMIKIIFVLIVLLGIYLGLTYFSLEAIEKREVDFYQS